MANNAHLSLFSGIGGLDLAAEWAGFRTVAFVERDKYCQRVLAKHWPGVPIYSDVTDVGYAAFVQRNGGGDNGCGSREGGGSVPQPRDADCSPFILSGGFPCQPHSVAGKRKASLDERDLWGECARIAGEFKPRWCVFENVPGLLSSEGGTFFARVVGDLAALGYRVGWGVWGANDVGALHRRDRVFIVANLSDTKHDGRNAVQVTEGPRTRIYAQAREGEPKQPSGSDCGKGWREVLANAAESGPRRISCGDEAGFPGAWGGREDVANANRPGSQGRDELEWAGGHSWTGSEPIEGIWSAEPQVGRVANGVPRRVDRLRALGNAVVPQQAYPIFKAIAEIEGINA